MANWKRITLVVFVLIGGTMTFGYWSRYQFNSALSDLEKTITANTLLVSSSLKKGANLASTSLDMTITADMLTASSSFLEQDIKLASTSKEISKNLETPTDLELSFNFPKKDDDIYVGCTYPISWQSSTTISSLETVLVDAGARKVVDPIASGLAKESTIETDSQNLNWKVGATVWPGQYYIKVSKINNADVEIRSKIFTINNMPKGINTAERAKICKKSVEG